MRSSISSSADAVRATRITWAPAAASASAVAAPIPRLAPVTSAILPANSFEVSVMDAALSGLAARDKRQRTAAFLLRQVGQRRRIGAGEAGVASLGLRAVAVLAERTIQPFDGDERQAVRIDIVAHLIDVHLRGQQFGSLRSVHAIEAAVLGRRRGNPHV